MTQPDFSTSSKEAQQRLWGVDQLKRPTWLGAFLLRSKDAYAMQGSTDGLCFETFQTACLMDPCRGRGLSPSNLRGICKSVGDKFFK